MSKSRIVLNATPSAEPSNSATSLLCLRHLAIFCNTVFFCTRMTHMKIKLAYRIIKQFMSHSGQDNALPLGMAVQQPRTIITIIRHNLGLETSFGLV
jgi:hypothetical protein